MARLYLASALGIVVICILFMNGISQVVGRKCVCTSKACKENGAKTCRTRFSCYTELIYSGDPKDPDATIRTTRGCTEGATPLLCESNAWHAATSDEDGASNSLEQLGRAAWPRLTCCDSHDYCNAADEDFEPQSSSAASASRVTEKIAVVAGGSAAAAAGRELQVSEDGAAGRDRDYRSATVTIAGSALGGRQNVQPLHLAALILALAALISVFSACYVVTRFLNASGALPHRISPYSDRLDF